MSIEITTVMLDHEGSTKFYEIVMLANRDSDRAYVIRRWGKMHLRNGSGGETRTEEFPSVRSAEQSIAKLIASKNRGGYSAVKNAKHGLHSAAKTIEPSDLSVKLLQAKIKSHYDSKTIADQAMDALRITTIREEAPPPKPKKIEPEPDRGSDWGAW